MLAHPVVELAGATIIFPHIVAPTTILPEILASREIRPRQFIWRLRLPWRLWRGLDPRDWHRSLRQLLWHSPGQLLRSALFYFWLRRTLGFFALFYRDIVPPANPRHLARRAAERHSRVDIRVAFFHAPANGRDLLCFGELVELLLLFFGRFEIPFRHRVVPYMLRGTQTQHATKRNRTNAARYRTTNLLYLLATLWTRSNTSPRCCGRRRRRRMRHSSPARSRCGSPGRHCPSRPQRVLLCRIPALAPRLSP